MLYVLRGWRRGEPVELEFTQNERETAIAIAKKWQRKGWHPFLYGKTHNSFIYIDELLKKAA